MTRLLLNGAMRRGSGAALLLFLVCCAVLLSSQAAFAQPSTVLEVARFIDHDDPSVAGRHGGEGKGVDVRIPCRPGDCVLPERGRISWFRMKFRVDEAEPQGGLGLLRGRVWGAEEVYLNGVKVDGVGVVGDPFAQVWGVHRVYSLPHEFLQQGENVLALRVLDTGTIVGPAFEPLVVGPEGELRARVQADAFFFQAMLAGTIALTACAFILTLVALFSSVRGPKLRLLSLCLGASLASWVLSATWWDATLLLTRVEHFVYTAVVGPCFALLPYVMAKRLGRGLIWFSFAYVALTGVAIAGFFSHDVYDATSVAQVVYLVGVGSYGCWVLAGEARRSHNVFSGLVAASILVMLLWILVSFIWPVTYNYPFGEGVHMTVVVVLCAVALHTYAERTRRVERLQEKLLSIADDERRAIAQELHDGVGQDLQAARMSLQLAARTDQDVQFVREMLRENASNLEQSLANVRALSRELHPGFGSEIPLRERLSRYVEQLSTLTGREIRLRWSGDDAASASESENHLFRVVQEALGNALRYGDDEVFHVSIDVEVNTLSLSVVGGPFFDQEGHRGLGWQTLRERATLLGGKIEVQDRGGRARVFMSVPREF